jgi:hypothetical protein
MSPLVLSADDQDDDDGLLAPNVRRATPQGRSRSDRRLRRLDEQQVRPGPTSPPAEGQALAAGAKQVMRQPPPVLEGLRLLWYAAVAGHRLPFSGHTNLWVGDGKGGAMREVGRMPALAICEDMDSREVLLCHCRRDWSVRGGSVLPSVMDAKARAARNYAGIARLWQKARVSRQDARRFLRDDAWYPTDVHFLNVDLHLKSGRNPAPIAESWGKRLLVAHRGRLGGRHWWRFMLRDQPADPATAVRRYRRLVDSLPRPARAIWNQASAELDIGFGAPASGPPREWVLPPPVVRGAASIGVAIRITIYPPEAS